MRFPEIEHSLEEYEYALENFIGSHGVPHELFAAPDHFAVKCANKLDYLDTCQELGQIVSADGLWEIGMDNRMLASAQLAKPVVIGKFAFQWLEIMQPRPEKEIKVGFVEHTEFFVGNLVRVGKVLKSCGVSFEPQGNAGHEWLNVVLDEQGREIKFNNNPLKSVVVKEHEQGLLTRVGL